MLLEIDLKKDFLYGNKIDSIYFGGGTPSILSPGELDLFINKISKFYSWNKPCEITLEANPDDLNPEYLKDLLSIGINRLSIGIQSFHEEDLQLMNRSHDSSQSKKALVDALNAGFKNVSADLMFGLINSTNEDWKKNLELLASYPITHISTYNLTIEEQTVFAHWRKHQRISERPEDLQFEQFKLTHELLSSHGFEHYEISNYAHNGFKSVHNQNYWEKKQYLGFGPSAHSYDGLKRSWNISNNSGYISQIQNELLCEQSETLSDIDRYNEYIMLGLRTNQGIIRSELKTFNQIIQQHFHVQSQVFISNGVLIETDQNWYLNPLEWFISDNISENLFIIN